MVWKSKAATLWVFMTIVMAFLLNSGLPVEGATPKKGGVLTFALESYPNRMEGCFTTDCSALSLIKQMAEGLVDLHKDTGEPVPLLATSWEISKEGETYTFHLRKGVRFHDGTPFNAQAAVFNIERLKTPGLGVVYPHFVKPIIAVRALDDYTLQIVLDKPYAPFLNMLGHLFFAMQSPTQVKKLGKDYEKHVIGTGPFQFVKHVRGQYVQLKKFPDYWQKGLPLLDGVKFVAIPELSSRIAALLTGEIDITRRLSAEQIPQLEAAGLKVVRVPGLRAHYVMLNTKVPPLDNVLVRKAMNFAVDKEAIVKNIYQGAAKVLDAIVAPGVSGYSPVMFDDAGRHVYGYDPKKAKELLANAGYPNGFTLPVPFLVNPGRYVGMDETVVALQAFWRQNLNINVKIEGMESATWLAFLRDPKNSNKYSMAYIAWSPATVDTDHVLSALLHSAAHPPSSNFSWYANPEVDKLIKLQGSETNPAKRKDLIKQVSKIIIADAPWIFTHVEVMIIAQKKTVHDVFIPGYEYPLLVSAWKE